MVMLKLLICRCLNTELKIGNKSKEIFKIFGYFHYMTYGRRGGFLSY